MTGLHSREGSVTTEARRAALTALAGLVALALMGAIASSDVADAAIVDLGALPQCDAQTTLCPDEDEEPREQIDRIVAANDRRPGDSGVTRVRRAQYQADARFKVRRRPMRERRDQVMRGVAARRGRP